MIAFIVMPLVEIAVLLKVGDWIGLWPTLGLIILTAIVGTWMLRRQGFAVLSRAQEQLQRGAVPLAEVFEGFCLVIAGALLLTPGFVTDVIGGSLLVPLVRSWLYKVLGHHLRSAVVTPGEGVDPFSPRPPGGGDRPRDRAGPIVEGDYEAVVPDEAAPDRKHDSADSIGPDVSDGSDGGGSTKSTSTSRSMPPRRGSWDNKS
ncbi:MAG: FxsA family protein [Geminicoccaceae bacterium]